MPTQKQEQIAGEPDETRDLFEFKMVALGGLDRVAVSGKLWGVGFHGEIFIDDPSEALKQLLKKE